MAVTSIEAIAEKLQETRQTELEAILRISGSAAISKNEYGVTVVDDTNVASSLVFKELHKTKYIESELVKAIDVEVRELKPDIPTPNKNLVPKDLYDELVLINEDLRKQVAQLNLQVADLTATVAELEVQRDTEINNRLAIEQTNDALSNQLITLTKTVDDFANQIQISLQKSVDEGILRASLQSQNTGFKAQIQALIKQVDSLNSLVDGLQTQLDVVHTQLVNTTNQLTKAEADLAATTQRLDVAQTEAEIANQALIQSQNTIDNITNQTQNTIATIQATAQAAIAQAQKQAETTVEQRTNEMAASTEGKVIAKRVVATLSPNSDVTNPRVFAKFKAGGGIKPINGSTLTISNNDTLPATVSITKTNPIDGNDFYILLQNFTVPPESSKDIAIKFDESKLGGLQSKWTSGPLGVFGSYGHTVMYKGGSLKISITRGDGTTDSTTFETGFGKYHPDSF